MFYVTKTYGHELGLSACFRQWKAESHCRFLHGYPLSFKFQFGCADGELLDDWVIDFGGLKGLKAWLVNTFDHRLLVAEDDPQLERIKALGTSIWAGINRQAEEPLADVLVIPRVGCEGFAKFCYDHVAMWLFENAHSPRVFLHSVEVREHGGNSAIYQNETTL